MSLYATTCPVIRGQVAAPGPLDKRSRWLAHDKSQNPDPLKCKLFLVHIHGVEQQDALSVESRKAMYDAVERTFSYIPQTDHRTPHFCVNIDEASAASMFYFTRFVGEAGQDVRPPAWALLLHLRAEKSCQFISQPLTRKVFAQCIVSGLQQSRGRLCNSGNGSVTVDFIPFNVPWTSESYFASQLELRDMLNYRSAALVVYRKDPDNEGNIQLLMGTTWRDETHNYNAGYQYPEGHTYSDFPGKGKRHTQDNGDPIHTAVRKLWQELGCPWSEASNHRLVELIRQELDRPDTEEERRGRGAGSRRGSYLTISTGTGDPAAGTGTTVYTGSQAHLMGFPVPSVLRAFRTVVQAVTGLFASADPANLSEPQIVSQLAGEGSDVTLGWLPSAMVPDYSAPVADGAPPSRIIGDSRQCTIWVPEDVLRTFLAGGPETVPDLLPGFETDLVGAFNRRVTGLVSRRGDGNITELIDHLEHGLGAGRAASMHRVGRTWTKRLHDALKQEAAEAGHPDREMDFNMFLCLYWVKLQDLAVAITADMRNEMRHDGSRRAAGSGHRPLVSGGTPISTADGVLRPPVPDFLWSTVTQVENRANERTVDRRPEEFVGDE